MKTEQAKIILKRFDRRLLKQTKDCVGSAIIYKNGKWVLQVFLQRKHPSHNHLTKLRLGEKPVIKKVEEQTPENELDVEVVETGLIKPFADHTAKYRPCQGGVSIGHPAITAGTFGCVVYKEKEASGVGYDRFILSNNHVLANSNSAEIGDDIYQPGPYDGGTSEDKIGELYDFVELSFDNPDGPYNLVDAAICKPTDENDISDSFLDQKGVYDKQKEAFLWEPVIKIGRTTGKLTGYIRGFTGIIAVHYDVGIAYFDDQIVTNQIGAGGDSGSLLMDKCGKRALGLLFAGNAFTGDIFYNKAEYIEELLGIEFAPKKRLTVEIATRGLLGRTIEEQRKLCTHCVCPPGPYEEQEETPPSCEEDIYENNCCDYINEALDEGTFLGWLITIKDAPLWPGDHSEWCPSAESNKWRGTINRDGNYLATERLGEARCSWCGPGCQDESYMDALLHLCLGLYHTAECGLCGYTSPIWCSMSSEGSCIMNGSCERYIPSTCPEWDTTVKITWTPISEATILPDIQLHPLNGGGTLKERVEKIKEARRKKGKIIIPSKKILRPKYPSPLTMAKSFGKAVVNHAKSGFKNRTEAEQHKVMRICSTSGKNGGKCDFFVPDSKIGPRCIKCGCCISLKSRWATAHCPIGKW